MSWDDAPDFEEELSEALGMFDWSRAAEICGRLVRRVHAEPEVFPEGRAKKCLSLLRRKRRFRLVTLLAEALLVSGQRAPQIRRQYAQALIDQGVLVAPEPVLQLILQDSRLDAFEEKEARGLLGRVYKQLYVNVEARLGPDAEGGGGRRPLDLMQRALSEYLAGYRLDTRENYWHGINAVALLARASRDQLLIEGVPDYQTLASDILGTLYGHAQKTVPPVNLMQMRRGLDAWQLATAMEALVALDEYPAARAYALEYAAHPDADAFEIASTLRQLEEVWQLTESEPPGSVLLPICRAALLQREGGAFRISPDAVAQDLENIETVNAEEPQSAAGGEGARTEETPAPSETLDQYRQALLACRAIARIQTHEGEGRGTGLLVLAEDFFPPGFPLAGGQPLLLTNAHVVSPVPFPTALAPEDASVVFQLSGRRYGVGGVVWSSPPDQLDAALLTLVDGPSDIAPLPLASRWEDREDVPPRAVLIGHPGGADARFGLKAGGDDERFSFQDARPAQADETSLRYTTPRRGGSSGSAVFDPRDWSVVALHHSGAGGGGGEGGGAATYSNEATPVAALRAAVGAQFRPPVSMGGEESLEAEGAAEHGHVRGQPFGLRERGHKSSEPPDAPMPSAPGPRFYFALEGEEGRVRGRLVRFGADVDLIFNYSVPPAVGVIGTVEKGERLEEARRSMTPLGVSVAPAGFAFRDEGDAGFRVMNFYDGGARSDKLRFELRAVRAAEAPRDPEVAAAAAGSDPPLAAAGFHVLFEVRGSVIYQFFLPVRLVSELPEPGGDEAELPPLSLDLDGINAYAEDAAADRRRMEAAVKEVLSNV